MVATAKNIKNKSDNKNGEKISWKAFQREYLTREDNFKYEWVNGEVEKTLRFELPNVKSDAQPNATTMHESQFFILDNLLEFFIQLKIEKGIDGQLIPEGDTFFGSQHRRPDIAYYTKKQIREAKKTQLKQPPQFIIEIISTNDQANLVNRKMMDYRAVNVPVVWLIYPKLKEVHIYHGKNMVIMDGNDACSAESVIEGFVISVKDVFK